MASLTWISLKRKYAAEHDKSQLPKEATTYHPLLPSKQRAALLQASTANTTGADDPLKASGDKGKVAISDPLSDPLSAVRLADDPLQSFMARAPASTTSAVAAAAEAVVIDKSSSSRREQEEKEGKATAWSVKKLQILKDYAMTGNITLKTSALDEFDGSGVEDGSNTRKVDMYTQRLASLEKKDDRDKTVTMTQKEYEDHINKLHTDLNKAWANDERVGSLKIAIQLAKLLADSNVPKFYPCMFVLVTDILDKFGDMVFTRLKTKAEEALSEGLVGGRRAQLTSNFKPSDIPITAKETCRNWFYKTACIRELLPRAYIEIALLKCYKFLTDSDFPSILSRLASIIRGIGDPLVAFYARVYLIRAGSSLAPSVTQHAVSMTQDMMVTYRMFKETYHLSELARLNITQREYLHSLSPAVEWLVTFAGKDATKEIFQAVLYQYREHSNDAMVLKHIIDAFDGSHYCHASLGLATLIKAADPSCVNIVDVFASLGKQLAASPPPENQRLALLNDVWKIVSKCEEISSYVRCTFAWLDTVQQHYSERETLILLADLSTRLQVYTDELPDTVLRQLESIVSGMVSQSTSLGQAVLTSEHLLKVLDVFKGSKKVGLCKDILEAFKSHPSTNDAILINTLFDLGRVLHDSVDHLSPPSEVRQLSRLILSGFIDKINFNRDLEQQLTIYVECRAIFCNMDLVLHQLVLHVSNLAVKALKFVRGKHNKKTAAFVKACLAYCHITIPSIADTGTKLLLLLHAAEVALLNNCLPQTDTFLKAAISLIPELPPVDDVDGSRVSTEEKLTSFVNNLLAFLVVVPGHPDHGPFYIVHGLLNALPKYSWVSETSTFSTGAGSTAAASSSAIASAIVARTKLYVNMLALFAAYTQPAAPYKIEGIDSNDTLYGRNAEYRAELGQLTTTVLEEIVQQLTALGEKSDSSSKLAQARLVIELVLQLSSTMELTAEVSKFVVKLLELAAKQQSIMTRQDSKAWKNALDYVLRRATEASNEEATQSLVTALRTMQQQ